MASDPDMPWLGAIEFVTPDPGRGLQLYRSSGILSITPEQPNHTDDWRLEGAPTLRQVAAKLNERGITTAGGRTFHANSVRRTVVRSV